MADGTNETGKVVRAKTATLRNKTVNVTAIQLGVPLLQA